MASAYICVASLAPQRVPGSSVEGWAGRPFSRVHSALKPSCVALARLLNFSAPCFPRLENEVNETYCAGLLWGFLFYLFYFLFYCGDMHITFTILAIFKCTIPWHLVH